MAWEWPRQGLLVQGLFDSKWYDGQIRSCHYKEKDGRQTAEVYEVEVQWDGECSQSKLPVEHVRLPGKHVRLRPWPEHPPVLRPWPLPPFVAEAVAPEVPPDCKRNSGKALRKKAITATDALSGRVTGDTRAPWRHCLIWPTIDLVCFCFVLLCFAGCACALLWLVLLCVALLCLCLPYPKTPALLDQVRGAQRLPT